MAVPSRTESARLLISLHPPAWHLRHSRAVAEVAAWIAMRAGEFAPSLDRRLVEAAALLHDVDKLPAIRPLVAGMRHGEGSGAWLAGLGHPELGPVIAPHPVTRLANGEWFERWVADASAEALIVAYADKRAGQRLETLGERFASWRRRYPPERGTASGSWTTETVEAVRRRAEVLEARVCGLARVEPQGVRRLHWTVAAIAAARLAEERR